MKNAPGGKGEERVRTCRRSGVAVDLPDIPFARAGAAAVAAADPFHDRDQAFVHAAASPEGGCVDPAGMAAITTGDLDVVPGSEIADTHPLTPFGKGDDVLVLFHRGDARSTVATASRGDGAWLGCNDMTAYRGVVLAPVCRLDRRCRGPG